MHLKYPFSFFLLLNLLSPGKIQSICYRETSLNKTKDFIVPQKSCQIDAYYDSLVQLNYKNLLIYKEINTPSGNKGLVIWKEKNCIYGIKFTEDIFQECKKEQINPDNQNLWLLVAKFFYSGKVDYSVTKSQFEAMHDFKIEIRALISGKAMKGEFFDSSVGNKSEFLPEIARLCQNIIYNW